MARKYFNSYINQSLPKINGLDGSLITVLDACLLSSGWSKDFTGTNVAVYKNGIGSNQRFFRVNDVTDSNGICKIRGYSSMTDSTDSGTNPFPTTSQEANGVSIKKSITNDSTNRDYIIVVDEKICYLFIDFNSSGDYGFHYFGDFEKYKSLETKNSVVSGVITDFSNTSSGNYANYFHGIKMSTSMNDTPNAGGYLAGNPNDADVYDTNSGIDGSTGFIVLNDLAKGVVPVWGYKGPLDQPISYYTNNLPIGKIFISNKNQNSLPLFRGYLNGVFTSFHYQQITSFYPASRNFTVFDGNDCVIDGIKNAGKFILIPNGQMYYIVKID